MLLKSLALLPESSNLLCLRWAGTLPRSRNKLQRFQRRTDREKDLDEVSVWMEREHFDSNQLMEYQARRLPNHLRRAMKDDALKAEVLAFWNKASCGEAYAKGEGRHYYDSHAHARYSLEPYIHDFARFAEVRGQEVLEIGVGMGADHVEFARNGPQRLCGVDLTPRAIDHVRRRLMIY